MKKLSELKPDDLLYIEVLDDGDENILPRVTYVKDAPETIRDCFARRFFEWGSVRAWHTEVQKGRYIVHPFVIWDHIKAYFDNTDSPELSNTLKKQSVEQQAMPLCEVMAEVLQRVCNECNFAGPNIEEIDVTEVFDYPYDAIADAGDSENDD